MFKKLISIMLSFMLSFIFVAAFPVDTYCEEKSGTNPAAIDINAKSAIIMESTTGKILYEKNSDERLAPASVTKIMTLLLIYDSVASGKIKWDSPVTVSEHAASMGGSQIFLEPNETQSVETLTKSIAIASANDAAVAMAEFIGGSEENFVAMMNEKAKSLNMTNTTFQNACGLDTDNHLMSAKDIAIMSRELMTKYPDIKKYTTTWQDNITHVTKKGETQFGLTNTNKLIKWYNGATGLKTGSTGKALYCLSGTAQRDGLELIAVVMAAPDPKVRFQEVMKMLDYGFLNYTIVKGEPKGKKAGEIQIYKGTKDKCEVAVKDEITAVVSKSDKKEITNEIQLSESLNAPIEKDTKAGEIIYYIDGKEIGRSDLVTTETINKATIGTMLKKLFNDWFC